MSHIRVLDLNFDNVVITKTKTKKAVLVLFTNDFLVESYIVLPHNLV